MRLTAVSICALVTFACLADRASADIFYSSGFEAPTYSAGSVIGVDGWAAGHNSGSGFAVSTAQAAGGSQSLRSDNTSLNGYYSVRHNLGTWSAAGGSMLQVSVDLWMAPGNGPNRMYGLYLGNSETSNLSGTVLGLTIDGAGRVRAGTSWSNTYGSSGHIGTAAPGSFLGRWLTITLEYDPATGARNAKIGGFAGTDESIGGAWTAGGAPLNLNLGTDWFTTSSHSGVAYFDNLMIRAPEPGSMGLLGLAFVALARRRA